MKAFTFVFLCALAAGQGRWHHGVAVESTRSAAALGENRWLVHLRIAVSTSGLLKTCTGSLIDRRFVLTSASCISDARFIWIRYGVVNVINPSLVTENSQTAVRVDPSGNIGYIRIGRSIQPTRNINPISPIGRVTDSARFCGYGELDGAPGEVLNCYDVDVNEADDGSLAVSGVKFSEYDIGGALVSNRMQFGLLVDANGNFLATAEYEVWLYNETGIHFDPELPPSSGERFVQ